MGTDFCNRHDGRGALWPCRNATCLSGLRTRTAEPGAPGRCGDTLAADTTGFFVGLRAAAQYAGWQALSVRNRIEPTSQLVSFHIRRLRGWQIRLGKHD